MRSTASVLRPGAPFRVADAGPRGAAVRFDGTDGTVDAQLQKEEQTDEDDTGMQGVSSAVPEPVL